MDINAMVERGQETGLIEIAEGRIRYPHPNKEYAADPEEYVRAATYVYLIQELQYPVNRIDLEVVPLRRDPQNPADILVYADDELNARFIVCEIKADSTPADVEEARRQGLGNANLQGAQYLLCVCGSDELAYNITLQPSLRNLEQHRIAQLPVAYGQAPTYRYTKGGAAGFDLRLVSLRELTNKFERSHKAIWEGGRRDPVSAFDEMSKIMFAKIYDEINTSQGSPYRCQIGSNEGTSIVASRIRQIYNDARQNQPAMFVEEIGVSDDILVEVVGILQDISLYRTDLDAKGRAFEQFIGKYFRGEYGQYFTPRNVVKAIVQIADLFKPLGPNSLVIDPACGSGGFLLEVLNTVRQKIAQEHAGDPGTISRLQWGFAENRLFGVEINEKIARVAMMDMVIHDDGSSNIKCHDALDDYASVDPRGDIRPGIFSLVVTNPPFSDDVDNRSPYYENYLVGGAGDIARGDSQRIYILFIERCLELLAEEGVLAIVLPDSAFTNLEFIPVCDLVLSRAIYLGSLSLPQHTFNPFGSDAKTTVFFFRKSQRALQCSDLQNEFRRRVKELYGNGGLTPAEQKARYEQIRREYTEIDYPILLVHIGKVGYTAVGRPEPDLLPDAVQLFAQYVGAPQDFAEGYRISDLWWNKIHFLDLISKLDVEAYNPAYFEAMARLESLEQGELRLLSDLCLPPGIQTGVGSTRYQDSGVPIVKTADVVKRRRVSKDTKTSAARIGFIQWDDIKDKVSLELWEAQGTKQLGVGDILIQCVAHKPEYIGDKIALVDSLPEEGKALALNKFLIIRPNPEQMEPEYLAQYLASEHGRLQMARYNRGMTAQIYEQDVRDFIVYLPPQQPRQAIVHQFRQVVDEIRNIEARYKELLDSLDSFQIEE